MNNDQREVRRTAKEINYRCFEMFLRKIEHRMICCLMASTCYG